jgi:hypothetical protein
MSKDVKTLTELAKQVKRDVGQISRWLRRADWPFPRRGPWTAATVKKIKDWSTTLAPNPAADAIDELEIFRPGDRADERAAKLKILQERGLKLEFERKMLEGTLVDKAEVVRGRVQRVLKVRNAMMSAGQRLALRLAGVSGTLEIQRIIDDELRTICDGFADDGQDGITMDDDPKVQS